MRTRLWFSIFAVPVALWLAAGPQPAARAGDCGGTGKSVKDVIEKLEAHYGEKNFTADFRQESRLEAMDITDAAQGRAWFKHPGKMRWAYQEPETYLIVTDGDTLWIHRPVDDQVVVGRASEYFGDGRGASFLADFSLIQDIFETSLADSGPETWRLKLVPRKKQAEIQQIQLEINCQTLEIQQVITENAYGDITRIFFDNLEFRSDMKDALFDFQIPDGTDVIKMEK